MELMSSYQQQQTSNDEQKGYVGSISGRAFIRRDKQRFRMTKPLFERILIELQQHDNYFIQKNDATGATGLSGIQKMTAVVKMLAYGAPTDNIDEYVKIGKSTASESLEKFCRGVVEIFKLEYLRTRNATDIARLLRVVENSGFLGC
ncbi:uncharacterized protein LOC141661090 [Apium graveolens]|uniref:uncharacterized protein LOC141661090 n=1 Tax=Apium graveolens TaxID=4045 RepID=UPI003D7C074F